MGSFNLSFQIDNQSPSTKMFSSQGSDPQAKDTQEEHNFKLFDTGELQAGNHTVLLNLTACTDQTLMVDFLTYTPSFSTLATMPNLTSSSDSAQTVSSTSSSSASSSTKVSVGAIVGGTLGGCALLILLGFLLFWRRNHSQRLQITDRGREAPNTLSSPYHGIFFAWTFCRIP